MDFSPEAASQGATRPIPRKSYLHLGVILYLLILFLGAVPGSASSASGIVSDKLLHFLAYAVLCAMVYLGSQGRWRASRALLVIALMGAIDEAIQYLLPHRDANFLDWNFDMLGAACSVALLTIVGRRAGSQNNRRRVRPRAKP